jgi:hypothetical protein
MPPPENDMELMERRMMGLDPEEDPEILELLSRSSSKVRGSSRDSAQAQPAVSQSPCRPDSALSQRSAVSSLKSAKNPADLQHNQIGDEAIKILRSASSSSLKSAHSLQELEDASRQAEVFLSVCLTLYVVQGHKIYLQVTFSVATFLFCRMHGQPSRIYYPANIALGTWEAEAESGQIIVRKRFPP